MGTRSGTVRRAPTVGRVPWDVPVELVPARSRSAGTPTVRTVDLGLALPGVRGAVATTVELDGRTLLAAIRPLPGPAPDARPLPLRELLAGLSGPDGGSRCSWRGRRSRWPCSPPSRVGSGERCTYAELAARAGRPRAVRAAAHVMATNRVPLVLPCHRVVPSGGGTGRYGWGDAVKPMLLAAEAAAARVRSGGRDGGLTGLPARRRAPYPPGLLHASGPAARGSLEGSHSPAECARLESG
jgi:O-6-methylguanine DNA methyltransferase